MHSPSRAASPVRTRRRRGAGPCRSAVFSLAATPEAARLVRSCAARLLAGWGVPAGDAIVVLAELLANAAEHGGRDMAVRLHCCGRLLEVEVVDTGCSRPLPDVRGAGVWGDLEGVRGRGLPMVSALSERFLLHRRADGSTRAFASVSVPLSVPGRVESMPRPRPRGCVAGAPGLRSSPV
ncbi:ATP-binding protein [Streptomyces aureus]|uniref:ATP-binding protein n=1 Tax=Streptomyces aureus TaxID=193461 RepID=UPI000689EF82|nr:ATP-binding protein [Streptomyces aureus]